MTKDLKTLMVTATEGLVSNVSDLLRGPNQAKVLNNVRQLKRGVFTTSQSGWVKIPGPNDPADDQVVSEFAIFNDIFGASYLLVQIYDTLYQTDLETYTPVDGASGLLNTAVAACFRMFSPYAGGSPVMVVTSRYNDPLYLNTPTTANALAINGDDTTASPLPEKTYKKPRWNEPFLDRMAYSGFYEDNADTSQDVLLTNAGAFDVVTQSTPIVATDGGIFTIPASLGRITALKTLKLTNQTNDQVLIVGCAKGVAMITGTDAGTFQMRILTDEYGIPSNRAIVVIQNDLFFLATDGIRRFSGLANNATLLNATMTFDQSDIIRRINPAAAFQAFANHHRLTQEVEFWFPLDENIKCNSCLLMNYNTNSSSYESVEPIWMTRDGTQVASMIEYNNIEYGGDYSGFIQQHHSGNLYDESPVPFTIVTAFMSPGDAMYDMQIDHMLIITEGESQQFTASAHFYQDMAGGRAIQRTLATPNNQVLEAPVDAGTILGSWQLGLSAFSPGPGVKLLPFRPNGKGRWWELTIEGNKSNDAIDFIGVEYKFIAASAKP